MFEGYWKDFAENFPELKHDAQLELQWLDQLAAEIADDRKADFDKLLDGLDQSDRFLRDFVQRDVERMERERLLSDPSDLLARTSFSDEERLFQRGIKRMSYEHQRDTTESKRGRER